MKKSRPVSVKCYHRTTRMTPVLCGTSYRNKGVQPLLDAIVDYLPSPLDIPAIVGKDPHSGEAGRASPQR